MPPGIRDDVIFTKKMMRMTYNINEACTILERTPGTLKSLLCGLSDNWSRATEGPETWSPYDVIGHLVHGERTDWVGRMKIILEQGESRAFTPFDRFAQFRDSVGKTLDQLLAEFRELRLKNIAWLQSQDLTEDQLKLQGIHPVFGEVSLSQLLSTWVVHDLDHISQVVRVMARQYEDAVGPWKEFLRILPK
jgi:uncharacterized damage-inducible protein DinB